MTCFNISNILGLSVLAKHFKSNFKLKLGGFFGTPCKAMNSSVEFNNNRHFHFQNVTERRFSWNNCFIIYRTRTADNIAVCRNTSEVVKIKMRVCNTPVPNCHSIMPCEEIPVARQIAIVPRQQRWPFWCSICHST